MNALLEIAVFSSEAAIIADHAGANRIELCSGYSEGGLTPSIGTIQFVKNNVKCPVFVMIRPRGGDFCYSPTEIEIMKTDIEYCKKYGVDGFVFGILDHNFMINAAATTQLCKAASPIPVTFHRAFDLCHDPENGMEILIKCGVQRILTSGQKTSALEGQSLIAELNKKSKGRIIIMAGAGINPENINELLKQTGCTEFHASAKRITAHYNSIGFGEHLLPHPAIIKKLIEKISS